MNKNYKNIAFLRTTFADNAEPASAEDISPQSSDTPSHGLLTVADLKNLPDPTWLIDGILPSGGLSVLFGDPGVGKSFLALDWSASIATGQKWLGQCECEEGAVIYVCAEGIYGFKNRVSAWEKEHVTLDDMPLFFRKSAVDISDPEQLGELAASIQGTEQGEPKLIVIDTLARCFGDGDENSAKDMNAFVAGVDWLRETFEKTTILIVHHSGKDGTRGARGSTALRGACDTEIRVQRDLIRCEKQKDAEPFAPIPLKFKTVSLSETLGEASSRVVCRAANDNAQTEAESKEMLSAKAMLAKEALAKSNEDGMQHKDWLKASGLKKSTFNRCRERLLSLGEIEKRDDLYYVVQGPESHDGPKDTGGE